ncbi:MAG: hypothetical protein HQ546_08270, partial [Planctomycetes bacterium]|nr:hypothetical protein [Planctomycetota bacterium]
KEGLFVEEADIVLDEPIRQLDKYKVDIRFAEAVRATISVWVVPARSEDEPADGQSKLPTSTSDNTTDVEDRPVES